MRLYPINLDINNKLCLVIGGGEVAARKAQSLLDAGAKVKVISPEVESGVGSWESGGLEILNRSYQKGDLKGAYLAIAATDDEEVNRQIAVEAKAEKVLLNIVDVPQLCDFYVPSVVRRGEFVLSISTSGRYPALSKKLRKRLEREFGPEYGPYLEILSEARSKVFSQIADLSKRKEKLKEIADLPLVELIKQGNFDQAKAEIERIVGS